MRPLAVSLALLLIGLWCRELRPLGCKEEMVNDLGVLSVLSHMWALENVCVADTGLSVLQV